LENATLDADAAALSFEKIGLWDKAESMRKVAYMTTLTSTLNLSLTIIERWCTQHTLWWRNSRKK